ncbi:hypothetical protein E4U40_001446 [Claviceps sp. LM458 group G5]|nr:hypothetical protein E4U40_001446 [Claviceps sp. LM458 group G5]
MGEQIVQDCTWLKYHQDLQILICEHHGYAVRNPHRHLEYHHPELSKTERERIQAQLPGLFSRRISWQSRNDEFLHGPLNPRAPIEGLTIHDGWSCHLCDMLTPSSKSMRMHYYDVHSMRGKVSRKPTVKIQTLYTSAFEHYFCVSPRQGEEAEACPTGQADVIDSIKEQWDCDQSQEKELQGYETIEAAENATIDWLNRTGWTEHYSTDRDLAWLYTYSRMPTAEDAELQRAVAAIDRMFFDRCIEGLKTLPLMTRLMLASPHRNDADLKPFGPLQDKAKMDRYVSYWKRFICYCLRVLPLDEPTLLNKQGFAFTKEQRASLEGLCKHLKSKEFPEEMLEEELLQVSASFWMQELVGDPFDSPLWHFVSVLGIDEETRKFRPAHLFTCVLSGLVYVARVLLVEHASPAKERPQMKDPQKRIATIRNDWLCKAACTPMGYTLSLLQYGKMISKLTGSSRRLVSWARRGEVMLLGQTEEIVRRHVADDLCLMDKHMPIHMDGIRLMMQKMIKEAEDLMWGSLMFKEGQNSRFVVPLAKMKDSLTDTRRGVSFLRYKNNGLAGKETEMLKDLVDSKRRLQFLNEDGQWNWPGVRQYLENVRKFEDLLAPLGLMTAGGPARGDEFVGLRRVNGVNHDRGIFVIDGKVVLATQSHKSLAPSDPPKVVPRFLPRRVDQLFVLYLAYVKPLCDRWQAEQLDYKDLKPPSDFIFHDENGPWNSSRLSTAMERHTHRHMGIRITLPDWWHISIAISKKHVHQSDAAKAAFGEGDYYGDDEDEEESERYEDPDYSAATWTTTPADRYCVTKGTMMKHLKADSLEKFGQVSRQWHEFLQLDRPHALEKKRHRPGYTAECRSPESSKRPCLVKLEA